VVTEETGVEIGRTWEKWHITETEKVVFSIGLYH